MQKRREWERAHEKPEDSLPLAGSPTCRKEISSMTHQKLNATDSWDNTLIDVGRTWFHCCSTSQWRYKCYLLYNHKRHFRSQRGLHLSKQDDKSLCRNIYVPLTQLGTAALTDGIHFSPKILFTLQRTWGQIYKAACLGCGAQYLNILVHNA